MSMTIVNKTAIGLQYAVFGGSSSGISGGPSGGPSGGSGVPSGGSGVLASGAISSGGSKSGINTGSGSFTVVLS